MAARCLALLTALTQGPSFATVAGPARRAPSKHHGLSALEAPVAGGRAARDEITSVLAECSFLIFAEFLPMTRFAPGALALAGWFALCSTSPAQETSTGPKGLEGAWAGTLKVNSQISYRLGLRVENGQAWIDSLDQGVKGIRVSYISLKKGKVSFESQVMRASYAGRLEEKAGEIIGKWTQSGGTWPLTWKRARLSELSIAGPAAPKEREGRWAGALKINEHISFNLALRVVREKPDEPLRAVIDSLDQKVNGIPVTTIALEKDQLRFENKKIFASFKGRLDAEKGEIRGTWTQPGGSWPIIFKKTN